MWKNGRRLMLLSPLLALAGCEMIGDASESIGAMVSPHLETLGGGPPKLVDDGGRAVNWYLEQVASDTYEACDTWREEVMVAVLKEDEAALKDLEARAEELQAEFQPHLDAMALSIDVQLPNPVQSVLGGQGLVTLDSCSLVACSLNCEGAVQVQEVKEFGDEEAKTWSSLSPLLSFEDNDEQRRASEIVCDRHPVNGQARPHVDENYEGWLDDLALAQGSDPDKLDSYSGPQFELDFNLEEGEEEPSTIKAGQELTLTVSHLDECLASDGYAVRITAASEPSIGSSEMRCGEKTEEGDASAEGEEGSEQKEEVLEEESLLVEFNITSPYGPKSFLDNNQTDSRDLKGVSATPSMELMVTETDMESMEETLVFHHQSNVTCKLPEDVIESGKSLDGIRNKLRYEMVGKAFERGSSIVVDEAGTSGRVNKVVGSDVHVFLAQKDGGKVEVFSRSEIQKLMDDKFEKLMEDEAQARSAYTKMVVSDPYQSLECELVLAEKALGDYSCNDTEKNYDFIMTLQDNESRWSAGSTLWGL